MTAQWNLTIKHLTLLASQDRSKDRSLMIDGRVRYSSATILLQLEFSRFEIDYLGTDRITSEKVDEDQEYLWM